jgi:hypothetical protein
MIIGMIKDCVEDSMASLSQEGRVIPHLGALIWGHLLGRERTLARPTEPRCLPPPRLPSC